ncbi:MAG: CHAT domain-containing protein, partial [Bacteroidia bacterium]
EQAKKAYDDAYQIIASNDLLQRSITFVLYVHYAKLYLNQKDYPQVTVFISKARNFAKRHFKVGDPRHARVDVIEVELAIEQKAFGKAETIALEIEEKYQNLAGDKNSRLAMIYNLLGQIMFEQGRWDLSHAYYNDCTLMLCPNLEKEIHPSIKPQTPPLLPPPGTLTSSPRRLITVLYNQALSFNREGSVKKDTLLWTKSAAALNTCIQWIEYSRSALLEPEERSNLTDFRYRVYELAMANAYQLSQASSNPKWSALAFAVAERSRANLLWENLQRDQVQNPTALSKQIVQQQNRLESSIQLARNDWFSAWQVDAQNPQLPTLQNEITRLQLSQDSLKYVISLQYPNYHKLKYRQELPSLKQIQSQLPKAHQLLEYFYTDTVLYLLQIQPNDYQIHRIKLAEDFAQSLQDWQQQLQNPALSSPQSLARLGHQLYQQLFPFALEADTSQSLLIIPDGPLTQLPFELLVREAASPNDYRDIPYLFEQAGVRYAYAAWTLLDKHDLAPTDKYWAGFAPSYQPAVPNALLSIRGPEEAIASLAGAETEVKRIAAQMSGESYMGAQASKKNFLKQAASFKVLHLALHAYILEDRPMYSGLIFGEAATQDTLLLHEIYPLKLQSELTVLSACNTGIGQRQRGEGNLSLAHAFAYAGCPSVVMSLWPVNDQSTQDLMEAFYTALKGGHSKSKALQIARKKYLQEHDLTHPYYWGAFVSIGDDASLSPPLSLPKPMITLIVLALLAGLLYYFVIKRKKNRSSVD